MIIYNLNTCFSPSIHFPQNGQSLRLPILKHYMIDYRLFSEYYCIYSMGQSMQKPTRSTLRNSASRFSARSLQRSSNNSMHEKRASMSASKLRQINEEESMGIENVSENTQVRNGELFIASKYEEPALTIKQANKLKIQRGSIGGQTSQHSPNFREIAETGVEYGLGHWGAANASKQSLQGSHNDVHHDITISFSKTKNLNLNVFNEENEERKSTLKQILEYDEESQHQKSGEVGPLLPNDCNQRYLAAEIDKIAGTHSMYSDNFNKNGSPVNTPPEEGTPKKLRPENKKDEGGREGVEAKYLQQKMEGKKLVNETVVVQQKEYNDYDCADFKRKIKDGQGKGKKVVKMSKKMEELKQKIANRAHNSKDKEEILKGSIQRLSKSLRKNRDGHSLDNRSRQESKDKLKPILSKVQCLDIKIESKAEIKIVVQSPVSKKKDEKIKSSKSPKQSIVEEKKSKVEDPYLKDIYFAKIRSSQQLGKTTNSSQNSNSKLYKTSKNIPAQTAVFNGNQDYVLQNLSPYDNNYGSAKKLESLRKEPSFTEMVKKEHFGNKLKKKGQEKMIQQPLKYSQVEKAISSPVNEQVFASTCEGNKFISGQEYQFFDMRELKKPREEQSKISKQQINSLKFITQQLTSKDRKSKIKAPLQSSHQSNHSSSHDQSARNKTYQQKSSSFDKPLNLTAMNYTDIIGNYEQYMLRDALNRQREGQEWAKQQKKRHKSSQHSSKMTGVKSRLLVF